MKRAVKLLLITAAFGAVTAPAFDAAAIIGMPLTPFSYAGVARRTVRRTALWGGAMYGAYGAAAYAPAAVPAVPAGCAPGYPCGGAVYQPAYQGPNVVYVVHTHQ